MVFTEEYPRPLMPTLDILAPVNTVHCSLGPIPHNESSNSGNIQVLQNIFRQQYHLPDSTFKQWLFLLYSNQLTIQQIHIIKYRWWQVLWLYDSL